ncbi:MAG: hypothetical protein ACREN8_05450 [Candidatus Dormibacteraceae bacterium]
MLMAVVLSATLLYNAARWHQEASDAETALAQAKRNNDQTNQQISQMHTQIASLQGEVKDLNTKATNPTLSIWNSCGGPCTVGPGQVRVGGVPDTFSFHVSYQATVPVSLYFLTFHQWTQFDSCGFQTRCISDAFEAYPPTPHRDVTFDKSTGCAGYLFVLSSPTSGTITPDVEASYRPADKPTGVCMAH